MSAAVEHDPAEKLRPYAHPERLVTTEWLAAHIDDPNLVVAESDEDVLLYETGHIPGAVKLDWHTDLNDPVTRDYVDGEAFARLMSAKGVGRLRPVGGEPVRARRRAPARRRQAALDRRGPAGHHRGAATPARRLPGGGARRQAHPRLPRGRAGPRRHRRAPGGRPLAPGVLGRAAGDARLPPGGSAARRPRPRRGQRALEARGQRRRHLQDGRRAARHLRGRARLRQRRRRDRLLPHRRALQSHLVRPHPPARLPAGAQLRRLLGGVGQRGAGADRALRRDRAHHPGARMTARGSGGLKSEAGAQALGGHAEPSVSPPVNEGTPARLAEVVEEFAELPRELRLEALLDYSRRVPPLPSALAGNRDAMEQVHECQTPFFVASKVAEDGAVTLWFDAPPEAPTTRGFAGILAVGLNGASVEEVLAVPDGFYAEMGLHEVVSPLRLRGIGAILARVKRQLRAHAAARGDGGPAAPS